MAAFQRIEVFSKQEISNIDTSWGAFLIKARGNAMFVDNRLLPRLNVAAYRGEVSLEDDF